MLCALFSEVDNISMIYSLLDYNVANNEWRLIVLLKQKETSRWCCAESMAKYTHHACMGSMLCRFVHVQPECAWIGHC